MTTYDEAKARLDALGWIDGTGLVHTGIIYVEWIINEPTITLDGNFTLDELEDIIAYIKGPAA